MRKSLSLRKNLNSESQNDMFVLKNRMQESLRLRPLSLKLKRH
jgi:hypothetical protein